MSSKKTQYQLKIPGQTDNLELIRIFVAAVADKAGFVADDVSKIELAVDEACANVIKHAYVKGTKEPIDVVIEIDYKKLAIIITDHGKGFDVKKISKKNVKDYIAEMRVGGLGIYLMKALMDEVEFNSSPGVKTQVKMVKYFLKNGELKLAEEK